MKSNVFIQTIKQWFTQHSTQTFSPPNHAEILSADQMQRYGVTLALSHTLSVTKVKDRLLKRLSQSEAILLSSYDTLNNISEENLGFLPAREWLLDNFYLIQEKILSVRLHLPKHYGSELPQLAGNIIGYPRVYDIAVQMIEHSDGRWDAESVTRFIAAYQTVTPLTLGELWAIPIMLSIALIENLSTASQRIVADKQSHELADYWANRLIEVANTDPKKLVILIADMARSEPPMNSAFVAELVRRLQSAALSLPLNWVEEQLSQDGMTIEQIMQEENKLQAANQVAVSNSISSLRRFNEVDWRDFVENLSVVHEILKKDPANIYVQMDFGTRDRYRHVVERLSRKSVRSESEVAEAAITLAKNSTLTREHHVGYYLIDNGLQDLKKIINLRISFIEKTRAFCGQSALAIYLSSITLITGLIFFILFYSSSELNFIWLSIFSVANLFFASQVAIALVNLAATFLVIPNVLPRMDFSKGIPENFQTLVVVPALLNTIASTETLVEALEVRFLGNRDANLYFALLTDFNDAPNEVMPEDAELLAFAKQKILALNQRYAKDHQDIFFLCHRARTWNESEEVWMGRERKRGKLEDLNHLLRGNEQVGFSLVVGDIAHLAKVKYVITLDTDTKLPRESAQELIATMAHPLNRAEFNAQKNLVIKGYGILQPRINEAMSTTPSSLYVSLCGNESGVDPYTRVVSDVYQDIFSEGSFIGKGIYDVDVYENVLGHCFPTNRILSHDLLEGCYIRSGFLSDVSLYEMSPRNYFADVKRRERWIRGDWQLASWLLPNVCDADGHCVKNPLSLLSKWKLFDNLRRSLVAISLLTLVILFIHQHYLSPILLLVITPMLAQVCLTIICEPRKLFSLTHLKNMANSLTKQFAQIIYYLACLPFEAWYSLRAIVVSNFRVLISKHHLLEWTPSDQVEQKLHEDFFSYCKYMCIAPVIAIIIALSMKNIVFSLPIIFLWFISPLIAYVISKPVKEKTINLNVKQIRFLKQTARQTWHFFTTFITADNHFLPPDNFQEIPSEVLARRTSPTNIGLSLLANLTAYDFGYITIHALLERTKNAMQTILQLERYRGHLYNWYDTETLAPLYPRYISSVDSGNLAGHLLTLRQGLLMLVEDTLLHPRYFSALQDTVDILASTSQSTNEFQFILNNVNLTTWQSALDTAENLSSVAEKIQQENVNNQWADELLSQCQMLHDEIHFFANMPNLDANATLRDCLKLPTTTTQEKIFHEHIESMLSTINTLSEQAFSLAEMDVNFLYDEDSHLLSIGFNVETEKRDESCYDLLASEARLGVFVAISQGKLLQESWFALGRLLTENKGEATLISWSGSMFEYLMPLLVMPTYAATLLHQTYHAVVKRQIAYGNERNVPWGISESGYNAVDNQYNYLYRAFGVPGLGFKRGLEEDLVIAPYASAMALMVDAKSACNNLQKIADDYGIGQYGFHEAIDFTPTRLPRDSKSAMVRSFMAHHQGMSFLSISYLLHEKPMQKRFVADPLFQSTLLLLQERMPKTNDVYLEIPKSPNTSAKLNRPDNWQRIFYSPNTHTPQVQLLSNGNYHLVLTQVGSGYSRYKDLTLTRWREDSTKDAFGLFSYVRDIKTGQVWSTAYQPLAAEAPHFKTVFTESLAEFNLSDDVIETHTEISISPEDDIELRRIRVHNVTPIRRTIEFTTYAEIVLAAQSADLAQPAFSNLFIETEILKDQQAILATRRTSDANTVSPWLCHVLNVHSNKHYSMSYETDRARFVGRGNNLISPLAMRETGDLSNTSGAVLDPIASIRCVITLEPNAVLTFDIFTGVTDTREKNIALIEKYHDHRLANRIFSLAWTHGQVLLHQLNISEADAQLYGKLAGAIIYASNTRRAEATIIAANKKGQASLWGYAISGDLPIILLRIADAENIELVQQLVKAQAYFRRKGLEVDLFILNEEAVSYRQSLQDQIMSLINMNSSSDHASKIVVRNIADLSNDDRILIQSVARIIISDTNGTLKDQLSRKHVRPLPKPALNIARSNYQYPINTLAPLPNDLLFFNGLGGFSGDGKEYIMRLNQEMKTPAPWANIIANPYFGTLVSESGQGYTFTENAQQFRLTPWDNDPLEDSSGELFYLRDDETGNVWSPCALPCKGKGEYQTRHGFGYSVFEHNEEAIHSEFSMYVAVDAPIKFFVLNIRNESNRTRQISATGYVAWVLGDLRSKNAMHIVTSLSTSGAIFAENHYNTDFGERTAFFDISVTRARAMQKTVTGDRAEFIGRNGSESFPAALKRKNLSGRVGAALDPCAALQLSLQLAAGESAEIVFTLGVGKNKTDAENLLTQYQSQEAAHNALNAVHDHWQKTISKLQVNTPDAALNVLANGWLIYQVLASRVWGRTGYYQSSGAFGFRDQLQDVMSLSHVAPDLFRAQILLCAAHQFAEGDVEHWWHPPMNRGVRTLCSDDYLWLPFAICHYIDVTNDLAVLDEHAPFLQGRPLKPGEESYYDMPVVGTELFTVYEHCVRAIKYGLKYGVHGLPLMGSCDWNDGMNLVGIHGKGESVWLAFFLYTVLKHFSLLATRRGDTVFAGECLAESLKLQTAIEAAWDGEWYKRAYFDDGTPLGSAQNTECRIDSIAQSWSVLSGAANPERAKIALASLYKYLVSQEDGVVKLLAPPFDTSKPSPGYIQGYVPGIRENGGQYTHGAVWATMAFAETGESKLAWELFNIINPIHHGRDEKEVARYKIEPYVMAGDVYGVAPHAGRGGWSWYTGSAGWMYRLITEKLLGIGLTDGNTLTIKPLIPDEWQEFSFVYVYGNTPYKINIRRGEKSNDNSLVLIDDGGVHEVEIMV